MLILLCYIIVIENTNHSMIIFPYSNISNLANIFNLFAKVLFANTYLMVVQYLACKNTCWINAF